MKINIHTHNLSISDDEQEYIEKKINHLANLCSKIDDASTKVDIDIDLDKIKTSNEHINIKCNMFVPKATLHAEAHALTVKAAIDIVEGKIRSQIEKYKAKHA